MVPVWVMVLVGAVAALAAIVQGDTLVEGIVLSVIFGLALWVALSVLPLPVWARQLALSGGVGLISGLIAAGVYGDFFASHTVENAGPPPNVDKKDRTRAAAPKDPGEFAEYSTVRVTRLIEGERFFSEGADEITRPPRVGDEGVVVSTSGHARERRYMVECGTEDGDTIWLAEFGKDELELVGEVGEADED